MTRRGGLRSLLILVVASACTLDLVDVDGGASDVASLRLEVRTDPEASDLVTVVGALDPGDGADGRQRGVVGPLLDVMGVALVPDTLVRASRLILEWDDSVARSAPTLGPETVILPAVAGVPTPVVPTVVLHSEAGRVNAAAKWTPGADLRLLTTASEASTSGTTGTTWSLSVSVPSDGTSQSIVVARFRSALPDTVLVPGAWLQTVDGDSLEVEIAYDRAYVSGSAVGQYELVMRVSQRLRWLVPVAPR